MNRCFFGDCRDTMRDLIAQGVRVQMCVTSPPYFGLRDYGTGTWLGGDLTCDHKPVNGTQGKSGQRADRAFTGAKPQQSVCSRCGARRIDFQFGLESTPEEYVANMVEVFRLVRDLLWDDGILFLNLGDSYAGTGKSGGGAQGHRWDECGMDTTGPRGGKWMPPPTGFKPKDLIGIPWRVAFALQADGWYLRSDIIWHKPNPMPESVVDRPTKSHEYLFMLAKSERYYYDAESVKEEGTGRNAGNVKPVKGAGNKDPFFRTREGFANVADTEWHNRNRRSVWTIPTQPYSGAHFATFPPALIEPCIMAGTSERGCCPTCGKPWERVVEKTGGRDWRNDRMKAKGIPGELAGEGSYKRGQSMEPLNDTQQSRTVGWRPGCTCPPHDPVPCVVLDPFFGSGTTGEVAQRLGRQWIGCELNPKYESLQKSRTAQTGMVF